MRGWRTCATMAVAMALGCGAQPPAFPPPADTGSGGPDDGPDDGGDDDGAVTQTTGDEDDASTGSADADDGTTGEPDPTALMLDGAPLEFGTVDTWRMATDVIVVTNVGDVAATGLSGTVSGAGFSFAGGAYPGEAGTCGASLDPSAACELDLAFAPGDLGPLDGTLEVAADNADPVVATLGGVGSGSTPNLLVNGDAETQGGPPPGWVELDGAWLSDADLPVPPHGGKAAFVGASAGVGGQLVELSQTVDISAYAELVDGSDLDFDFAGWQRGDPTEGEQGQIVVELLDADGDELDGWQSNPDVPLSWTERQLYEPLPDGTRRIRVTLQCENFIGEICGSYFDDLELYLLTD